MEDKKPLGIKIFGLVCIFISIFWFLTLFKRPQHLTATYILIYIGYSIYSFIWLAIGIGLIKLRLWARYAILALALFEVLSLISVAWIFGSQILNEFYYLFKILIAGIIFFYFNKQSIKKALGVGLEKIGWTAKAFIGFLLLISTIALSTAPLSLWYQYSQYKDIIFLVNVKPEKIQYPHKDEAYLKTNGEKVTIFNYSLYLPKESKLYHIENWKNDSAWVLYFIKKGKDKSFNNLTFSISSNTDAGVFFRGAGKKILHFNTPYELEKTINYPTWSPLYLYYKIEYFSGKKEPFLVKKKEEIATPNWRGFAYLKQINTSTLFRYDLYSNSDESSACIRGVLINRDNVITFDQMRDLISSIKFNQNKINDTVFFNQGKEALANADYDSAALNFFNAFYINEQNPEYAYYLGRSLFMDDLKEFRRSLLSDSKYFLEYALKLKANYPEAKELLNQVNSELNIL